MDAHSSKAVLRRRLKQERRQLTGEELGLKSAAIVEQLMTVAPWQDIRSLHYFEPLKSQNEPNIAPFITFLQNTYPRLDMYTSRKIDSAWQVVRLHETAFAQTPKFDAVIVPMLGFDNSLHRLGHGGGYYDRFLATQPQAYKIGVCFELGHVQALPVEAHDIPLDVIITELATYG